MHDRRAELGFSGCERYDCLGAGQRASRLFEGRRENGDDDAGRVVFDAFRVLREVHELLELLRATESLRLDASQRGARDALLVSLERDDWTPESLERFERLDEGACVRTFLRSLARQPCP